MQQHTPTAHVIDYRNPRDAAFRQRVRATLLRPEEVLRVKLVAMCVAGAALSFAAPAVVTLIVLHAQNRWGVGAFFYAEASIIFLIASLVLIPLLYGIEHFTRGRFFEDAVRAHGLGDNVNALAMLRTSSRGEHELQTTAASWAAYLEFSVFAPRMMMGALRQWRRRKHLGAFDVTRAAEAVHALLARDGGVHPHALLRTGETPEQLWPVLLLLTLHDWTGIFKAADRIWLLTDARRRLT